MDTKDKYSRNYIASFIYKSLLENKDTLIKQWHESEKQLAYFYLDNLLPEDLALEIRAVFPKNTEQMVLRKSLRELKFITAQMNKYNSLLEETIYAFQDEQVVRLIGEITNLTALEPDTLLYAGGISMMAKNHFLNPHLDNSHDKDRLRYRVLNLLFYISPDWTLDNGGNLELWPNGPLKGQITVESKFNRLAVMMTNDQSWHSVSKVRVNDVRCCISNYYFSKVSPNDYEYFQVTSFRGRPEQKLRNLLLKLDSSCRMFIRKLFPSGIVETKHYYKK